MNYWEEMAALGEIVKRELPEAIAEIERQLPAYRRVTRGLNLTPGDPGPIAASKIGGVPFWPNGLSRPQCAEGHAMAFLAQFMLSDANLAADEDSILVFHYCTNCMLEGHPAWGWTNETRRGYDVSVFEGLSSIQVDGLGIVGGSPYPPSMLSFDESLEIPATDDLADDFAKLVSAVSMFCSDEDMKYLEGQGIGNLSRSKVGGWPTWVQNAEWPHSEGVVMDFVAQLGDELGSGVLWGGGGYAYLFVTSAGESPRRGELAILTT